MSSAVGEGDDAVAGKGKGESEGEGDGEGKVIDDVNANASANVDVDVDVDVEINDDARNDGEEEKMKKKEEKEKQNSDENTGEHTGNNAGENTGEVTGEVTGKDPNQGESEHEHEHEHEHKDDDEDKDMNKHTSASVAPIDESGAVEAKDSTLSIHRKMSPLIPIPPEEEDFHLFHGKRIEHMLPSEVAAVVEDGFISTEGARRALHWKPHSGDVICACPKSCGQGIVLTMIHMLASQGEGVGESGSHKEERWQDTIPWIESRKLDGEGKGMKALHAPQDNRSFRILKTHMSCKTLENRIDHHQDAKFITVLRHPYDQRLAWFKHLEENYKNDKRDDPEAVPFTDCFTAEDFALIPTTACRLTNDNQKDSIYEDDLYNWTVLRGRENVLVLCYEEIVKSPRKALLRIAAHLKAPCSDDLVELVMRHIDHDHMRESYHVHHAFHPETGTVGEGRRAFSEKICLQIDDLFFDRFAVEFGVRNYEDLYELVTGDEFPFPSESVMLGAKQEWLRKQRAQLGCCQRIMGVFQLITTPEEEEEDKDDNEKQNVKTKNSGSVLSVQASIKS